MRNVLSGLLFALLLLLTQQGAVLHELSHLTAPHAQLDTQPEKQRDHPVAADLCTACLGFGQAALGASPQAVLPSLRTELAYTQAPHLGTQDATPGFLPARSRGPPAFL